MKTKTILCLFLFCLFSSGLTAQEPQKRLSVEFTTGASLALNKLDNAKLKPGFGFETTLHYRFLAHTGLYAGWGWNRMNADDSFAGEDACFEETGYVFGLQFKHPLSTSPMQWFIRAGGLYNHIELENPEGDIVINTDHGLGAQLAAGIDIPIRSGWSIAPGIKFNSLQRDIKDEGINHSLNLNYLQLRVGIIKSF